MDLEQIATDTDFSAFLRQLSVRAEEYPGSLEEYLCSVLRGVSTHQDEPPTWHLLAHVLAEGLTTPPAPFEPTWLEYTDPPELITQLHPVRVDPFADVQHILRYQIADLHRMAEVGTINDPQRYYGIDSPTGHRWFNFDTPSFLECASAGMEDGMEDNHGTTECSWDALTITLWLGQIYE
jgi:hypothetical protein